MAKILQIPTMSDERGSLSVIDGTLPFEIKRVFYIYNVSSKRGGHRHINNSMGLVALNGSMDINVQTQKEDVSFHLSSPDQVLILDPEDWHVMDNFTKGAVLLVLCSLPWSKEDYIYEPYRKKND